jgi:Uma2 family endonuclease
LNAKLRRLGCYIRIQQPVTLAPFDEPEPDAALVPGTKDDYLDHHPGARQVLCVIEVADSSLEYDRTVKQQVYANSGIRLYVIVNLTERLIELFSDPMRGKGRYRKRETYSGRQRIMLPTPGSKAFKVLAGSLLPPAGPL